MSQHCLLYTHKCAKANLETLPKTTGVKEIEKELARKSAAEWEPVLQGAGVPCARLRTLPECLASEQVTSRGFIHQLKDGLSIPTLPFRLNGAAVHAPTRPAPLHGADTDEIKAWLGGRE